MSYFLPSTFTPIGVRAVGVRKKWPWDNGSLHESYNTLALKSVGRSYNALPRILW